MAIWDTPEMRRFRAEVGSFCRQEFPDDLRQKLLHGHEFEREDYVRWQKILQSRHYYVGHWPKEFGGCGWSALERFIFDDEMLNAGCPYLPPFNQYYIGPILYTFGTEAQQQRYLAATRNSDLLWCQGYSEPNAGSDLAGLRTRAVREGDSYLVNGQKIWTSNAHMADMVFCLVRTGTGPKPSDGISFLMVDLKAPGVSVRPIITMDMTHHCNEVFFQDVRVPADNLVGEEGKAWEYSRYLLSNERLIGALVGKYKRMLRDLLGFAEFVREDGRSVREDPFFRREVAEIEILMRVLESVCLRVLSGVQSGGDVGPAGSILKLRGSELEQRLGQLMIDVLGRYGVPFQLAARQADWRGVTIGPTGSLAMVEEYLMRRAATIYGGSSEIMHNIIGRAALGFKGV